jgi:motility quorum-sensing regulator/GCU-specific mRNA interferase toxin
LVADIGPLADGGVAAMSAESTDVAGPRIRACLHIPSINQKGYFSLEKRVPHCRLSIVRRLILEGQVRATVSALNGAALLGLDFYDVLAVLMEPRPADFYKSMTTHGDHRIWQDVYQPLTSAGRIYLKITVMDDVLVASFKEREA